MIHRDAEAYSLAVEAETWSKNRQELTEYRYRVRPLGSAEAAEAAAIQDLIIQTFQNRIRLVPGPLVLPCGVAFEPVRVRP